MDARNWNGVWGLISNLHVTDLGQSNENGHPRSSAAVACNLWKRSCWLPISSRSVCGAPDRPPARRELHWLGAASSAIRSRFTLGGGLPRGFGLLGLAGMSIPCGLLLTAVRRLLSVSNPARLACSRLGSGSASAFSAQTFGFHGARLPPHPCGPRFFRFGPQAVHSASIRLRACSAAVKANCDSG